MSEEKVLTLRGKRAVWAPGGGSGPIDPKRLPEGYPYKEQSRTEFAILGVVEFVDNGEGGAMVQTFATEKFAEGEKYAVVLDGKAYEVTAFKGAQGVVAIGNESFANNAVWDDNDVPFGVMAMTYGQQIMLIMVIPVSDAGTHSVEIYKLSETIHPMSEEFLPAGVGGGGAFIVNVTVADDGATCTADKTFAEMEEAYLSGKVVKVVETQVSQYMTQTFVYDLHSYVSAPQKALAFVNVQPGASNFRFNAIDFMEDSAYKTVYTMTGTFA